MAFDNSDGVLDWATRILENLGSLLPIALFLLVSIFGRGKGRKKQPQQAPPPRPATARPAEPAPASPEPFPGFPFGPFPMPAVPPAGDAPARTAPRDRQWGGTFDRAEGDALRWGSAFDDSAGGKVKWGSVFDSQGEPTKWGFDGSEWGSSFGPKRDSEPKITVG